MILKKMIKSSGKCNPKCKTYFSFAFHLRNSKSGKLIPFKNMNANTQCVCYIRHKQAPVKS